MSHRCRSRDQLSVLLWDASEQVCAANSRDPGVKTPDHAPAARFEEFALMGIIMAAVVAFRRQATVCALHLTRDCVKGARQEDDCPPYTTLTRKNSSSLAAWWRDFLQQLRGRN
jgi:hypothetical protein